MRRDKSQESGNVIRWFESEKATASLVKGDFPNERELRVSSIKGSIKARGEFKDISNKKLKEQIKRLMRGIK